MTKEEFINIFSKADDKLSVIRGIKSIKDIGLGPFELVNIIKNYLSKEEIIEIIKGKIFKGTICERLSKREKLDLLFSIDIEGIIDVIKENRKLLEESEIDIYDLSLKMNPEQQAEFIRGLINTDVISINEMREIVALMSPKAKGKIDINELPDECKEAYKIERYEVFSGSYNYGKIKIDLEGDLTKYRGLDRLIYIGGDNIDVEKVKRLIKICPNMKVYDRGDGPGMESTAEEYLIAKDWIDECMSKIPEEYTPIQKIALVDSMIGQQFCYSPDYETEKHDVDRARAAWTVIASRQGVCAGIAKVEQIMLKRLGIDAEFVQSPNHAFIKVNGLEIAKTDGTIETGSSIVDPTWNLASHRFKGMPNSFLVSYDVIRSHDIRNDKDCMSHKNDRMLSDANLMLDEQSLRAVYSSIGLANENGIFPIAKMNEMSDNMNQYKRSNPQENIDGQLRILKKFCPEFNSCIYESMKILRQNLLNKENMGIQKVSISKVYSKDDIERTPLISVYAVDSAGKEIFFVADKDSKGFIDYKRENFVVQFDRFQEDKDNNGQKNPWDVGDSNEEKVKSENECENER